MRLEGQLETFGRFVLDGLTLSINPEAQARLLGPAKSVDSFETVRPAEKKVSLETRRSISHLAQMNERMRQDERSTRGRSRETYYHQNVAFLEKLAKVVEDEKLDFDEALKKVPLQGIEDRWFRAFIQLETTDGRSALKNPETRRKVCLEKAHLFSFRGMYGIAHEFVQEAMGPHWKTAVKEAEMEYRNDPVSRILADPASARKILEEVPGMAAKAKVMTTAHEEAKQIASLKEKIPDANAFHRAIQARHDARINEIAWEKLKGAAKAGRLDAVGDKAWALVRNNRFWQTTENIVRFAVTVAPAGLVGSLARAGAAALARVVGLAGSTAKNIAAGAVRLGTGAFAEGTAMEGANAAFFRSNFDWKNVGTNTAMSFGFHGGGKAWAKGAEAAGLGLRAIEKTVPTAARATKRTVHAAGSLATQATVATGLDRIQGNHETSFTGHLLKVGGMGLIHRGVHGLTGRRFAKIEETQAMKLRSLDAAKRSKPVYAVTGGEAEGRLILTGKVLGEGSASTVYEGVLHLNGGGKRRVAVKVPDRAQQDPRSPDSFAHADMEAARLRQAESLGLGRVRYYGRFTLDGMPAIVTNRAPGRDVFEAGRWVNDTTVREVNRMFDAIEAKGLKIAHWDFQFQVDPRGRVHLIDLEGFKLAPAGEKSHFRPVTRASVLERLQRIRAKAPAKGPIQQAVTSPVARAVFFGAAGLVAEALGMPGSHGIAAGAALSLGMGGAWLAKAARMGGNQNHNKEANHLSHQVQKRLAREYGLQVGIEAISERVHNELARFKENAGGVRNGNVAKGDWPEVVEQVVGSFAAGRSRASQETVVSRTEAAASWIEQILDGKNTGSRRDEIRTTLRSRLQIFMNDYGFTSFEEVPWPFRREFTRQSEELIRQVAESETGSRETKRIEVSNKATFNP